MFGDFRTFYVEKTEFDKNIFSIKFKNFDSSEEVSFLLRKKIYYDQKNSDQIAENLTYINDLIGSKVFRNSEFFGYLIDVLSLPANDVFVIEKNNGEEILIPAVEDYIDSFDKGKKKLILREGSEPIYDDED